jgi:hypothetical protein
VGDINAAISNLQSAADRTTNDHPKKPPYLDRLGRAQQSRFVGLGEPHDIEAAISNHKKAVELVASDDVKKPVYLENLATAESRRPS